MHKLTLRVLNISYPRLHVPVSGISFLGPCFSFLSRIPQDSCGFLFFPEEFFHRNLLLAWVRKFRFLAKLTGILHRFLYIPAFDPDSCIFLRNPPDSSGIPVPAKSCLGPDWVAQLVLPPWDVMIGPPHPLDTHRASIIYIFKVFYLLYMWLVSIWMQVNTVIACSPLYKML